jgi:hypothetical protein
MADSPLASRMGLLCAERPETILGVNLRSLCLVSLAVLLVSCSKNDDDSGGCVLAQHVDQCCSDPVPAAQRELDSNPCLQRWGRASDVAACPNAQPCNLRVCPDNFVLGQWTRAVGRSGSGCAFQHECNTDADCGFASNRSRCCACPEWVPRQLMANDACYVPEGQTVSSACDACVEALPCDACPATSNGRCAEDGATGWRKCLRN